MGKAILAAAHFMLGALAIASIDNAKKIASRIKDPQVRDAALSYPNIATETDPWIRGLACLSPAAFFLIAVGVWTYRRPERDWVNVIMAFSFGVMPYVVLLHRAIHLSEVPDPSRPEGADSQTG
jgi:hypothetical protein